MLANISPQQLRKLTITQVQWSNRFKIGFALSDGQNCKFGGIYELNKGHVFDPAKKITRVETCIDYDESGINRINFYHHQERLVAVKLWGGIISRTEDFYIADDEQLIGCELDKSLFTGFLSGVTWQKMKVRF